MAKVTPKTTAVSNPKAATNLIARPEWLPEDVVGVEDLSRFIVPPRLKIIQPLTKAPLIEMFDPGAAVIVPQNVMVADVARGPNNRPMREGNAFFATPILFYPEWIAWNPLETRGTLPAIRERTLDPSHKLAAKCRDASLWYEVCPELPEKSIRNCEHLNFVLTVYGVEELGPTPIVVSFSRGEYRVGTNFAALVKLRRASIFAGVYQFKVEFKSNNKGEWFGLGITNPDTESGISPWVTDKSFYDQLEELHKQYASAHEQGAIRAEYDEEPEAAVVDAETAEY